MGSTECALLGRADFTKEHESGVIAMTRITSKDGTVLSAHRRGPQFRRIARST
jgi:hypothetical protein